MKKRKREGGDITDINSERVGMSFVFASEVATTHTTHMTSCEHGST